MIYLKRLSATTLILLCVSAGICRAQSTPTSSPDYRVSVEVQGESLANARDHFKSKILRQGPPPAEWPDLQTPKGATEVVYPSGQLKLKAWISTPSRTGKQEAVLFLHPGFALWPDEWDFTKPLRDAGYIVMIPTTRGENGQHGVFTMYYDEVSDVINAAEYLRFQPEVDPKHLYIAGYSVGGTLTLLASEIYDHFRAAASISGTPDLGAYLKYARGSKENAPFDSSDPKEVQIRSRGCVCCQHQMSDPNLLRNRRRLLRNCRPTNRRNRETKRHRCRSSNRQRRSRVKRRSGSAAGHRILPEAAIAE